MSGAGDVKQQLHVCWQAERCTLQALEKDLCNINAVLKRSSQTVAYINLRDKLCAC